MAMLLLPLSPQYVWLQLCCVLFGLCSAVLGVLVPVIILDVLGPTSMAAGYGNLLLFEAVGQVLGAPMAGFVYDHTEYYPASMYLGGAAVIMSSLAMIYVLIQSVKKLKHISYLKARDNIVIE